MAHLRPSLDARGILCAAELADAANARVGQRRGRGDRASAARHRQRLHVSDAGGRNRHRQRDVTPDLFQANRTILHRAQILLVEGPLQKQDGVIHVRARRFTELKTPGAMPPSHDFH